MPATIAAIHRYPVKGLSPERLPRVAVQRGQTLPADRRYAIENGPSGFDPATPRYLPKTKFLMLMRDERLAALCTHYDDSSHVLTIRHGDRELAGGDLSKAEGRAAIEDYFAREFAPELRGPPRVLEAGGHSFSDVSAKVISLINLESVAALADMVGAALDPLRFRGNLQVSGWPSWHELDLLGKTLVIGTARLKVVKRIVRCAAINVDPSTGARDQDIPHRMMRELGHMDCGVYAEVVDGGEITEGDTIAAESPAMV